MMGDACGNATASGRAQLITTRHQDAVHGSAMCYTVTPNKAAKGFAVALRSLPRVVSRGASMSAKSNVFCLTASCVLAPPREVHGPPLQGEDI